NTPGNPRLYETIYTLSAADSAKTLDSITFNSISGGHLNIFAITANISTQTYANPLEVLGNATLDVQNSLNANFGTLSIGANTLSVTGTTGAVATVGATTLSGNAIFSPAAGVTLSLNGIAQDSS